MTVCPNLSSISPTLPELCRDIAKTMDLDASKARRLETAFRDNWLLCQGRGMEAPAYEGVLRRLWDLFCDLEPGRYPHRLTRDLRPEGTEVLCIETEGSCTVHVLLRPGAALFVDAGPRRGQEALMALVREQVPDLDSRRVCQLITHADVDHVGVFEPFEKNYCARIVVNSFHREAAGGPCSREVPDNFRPAAIFYRLMTGYQAPDLDTLVSVSSPAQPPRDGLELTGTFDWEGLHFRVFEGGGGHVEGELVLIEDTARLVLAGDLHINGREMLPRQRVFNDCTLAVLGSADILPELAMKERKSIKGLLSPGEWTVCCGHGALARWSL